jgi:SAM-dependent methyltransferase
MTDPDTTLDLPFDQYQRYRLVADLIADLEEDSGPFAMLDVGGRTALLRSFLPGRTIALVDPEPSDQPGLVLGSGEALPFPDGAFDAVCAFDTLEHVPPDARTDFVRECARVARRWVFLAGPYAAPEVDEAEELVQAVMARGLDVDHRYLSEHRKNGLPDREAVEHWLRRAGAEVASHGHGQLETWLVGMCAGLVMDAEPSLQAFGPQLHRFVNSELYGADHGGPVYRHVVVAAFGGARLPMPRLEEPRALRLEGPRRIVEHLCWLGLGAVARGEIQAERARFRAEEARWLKERAEHEEERRTLAADLAEHGAKTVELETTLATERADLAAFQSELEQRLGEHAAVEREIRAELERHQAERGELERELQSERTEGGRARAALEQDLAGHRAVLAETREELERHRDALATAHARIHALEAAVSARQTLLGELEAELRDRKKSLARVFAREKYRLPDLD